MNVIRSLASVNRLFYQICTPHLFEALDLQGLTVNRLKSTLKETIKKHPDHVGKLRWRVSDLQSAFEEDQELQRAKKIRYDSSWTSQWGPKSRSEVILKILKSCPNLVDLDIDLDPNNFMPTKTPEAMDSSDFPDSSRLSADQMPNIFIKPISQLTPLTHLSLTSPSKRPPYIESFLVDILSNLHQLRSFACSRVAAAPLHHESPLGLHLASLSHLVELHLDRAECLDARWNQYKWNSSLKVLSLIDCHLVSVSDLHGVVELFKSTLTTLVLVNVPWHLPSSGPEATIEFQLPRLTSLEIRTWSLGQFSRAFEHSKNLSWLSLGHDALSRPKDLEALIQERFWPKLQVIQIISHESCTHEEVSGLEDLCRKYRIEIIFNAEFYLSDNKNLSDDDEEDGCDIYGYGNIYDDLYDEGYYKRWPRCAYADSKGGWDSDL